MSAFPRKSDIIENRRHVRCVPIAVAFIAVKIARPVILGGGAGLEPRPDIKGRR
jgi:hypothetical protein